MNWIYWDNAATTRPDPELMERSPELEAEYFANPSSQHKPGGEVRKYIESARDQVKQALNADDYRVVFTGSGSEANNLGLRGSLEQSLRDGDQPHVLTAPIEHKAVLNTLRDLTRRGLELEQLPTDGDGRVVLSGLENHLRPDTALVSVMTANNELGTIQPIDEIANLLDDHPACFHTDAVQAVGKIPIDLTEQNVDLLSLTAHKFHGFKGTGALLVKDNQDLHPLIQGGGQEFGLRSGTQNLRGIWGLGEALQRAVGRLEEFGTRIADIRDRIEEELQDRLDGVHVLGQSGPRLPNISSLALEGISGSRAVQEASNRGLCISSGSACDSGDVTVPSHVMRTLDLDSLDPRSVIRLSFGHQTTPDEVEPGINRLVEALEALRR